MNRIIAILNQKGGVGKTTTTINLGAYLAKAGKSVLIIDFDPQGNATSGLGIDKQVVTHTVYDAALKNTKVEQAIIDTHITGLSIMPANANLAALEVEIATNTGREFILRQLVVDLNYD